MRWVYFIQAGADGPVKVGAADDPELRLTQLQTGNPDHLRLLATYPGGKKMEGVFHRELAESRLNGEWFGPSDTLRRIVAGCIRATSIADERGWCSRCAIQPVGVGRLTLCDSCAPSDQKASAFQTPPQETPAKDGNDGGGGNRTRVTSPAESQPEQGDPPRPSRGAA